MFLFGFALLAVGLVIAWMIQAGLLMLAAKMCGAPAPHFGGAMLITLAVVVTGVIVEVAAIVMMGFTSSVETALQSNSLVMLAAIPIHGAVAAAIYRALLPTSFARAFLVWLIQIVIMTLLCVALGLALGGIVGMTAVVN